MRSIKSYSYGLTWVALFVACLAPAAARAEESKPPLGYAVVRSFDAAAALAKDIGLELPPTISPQAVEEQLKFLEPGSIATDQPIGIVMFAAEQPEKGIVFMIPLKPGTVSLDSLKKLGGQPVPDHDDTLKQSDDHIARRTANHLLVGADLAAVTSVKDDQIVGALSGPENLVRLVVDMKVIRAAMPEQFKEMVEKLRRDAIHGDSAERAGGEWVLKPVMQLLETAEKLQIGIDHGGSGLQLSLSAQPVKLPAAVPVARPGMPANVFVRLDIASAPDQVLPVDPESFHTLIDAAIKDQVGDLADEDKARIHDAVDQTRKVVFGGTAMSVGVEMNAGLPVVYIVNRVPAGMDLTMELRKLVGQAKTIAERFGDAAPLDMQTYPDGDLQVVRTRAIDKGEPIFHIDAAQRGDIVLMAGGVKEFRYIDRLLAAKPEEPMKGLAALTVNVGKLFELLNSMPGGPMAGFPDEQRKQLGDQLAGQKLVLTAQSKGEVGTVELAIPKVFLQIIAGQLGGTPPPAPGAGQEPAPAAADPSPIPPPELPK